MHDVDFPPKGRDLSITVVSCLFCSHQRPSPSLCSYVFLKPLLEFINLDDGSDDIEVFSDREAVGDVAFASREFDDVMADLEGSSVSFESFDNNVEVVNTGVPFNVRIMEFMARR